jgi:PhnB protein
VELIMKKMNPYLIFEGNCRQAMEFYKQCLGGEISMMTYAEAPGVNVEPQFKNWVIHARITNKSFVLMASDTRPGWKVQRGNGYDISIDCESIEEIEKIFKALSDKGQVAMPLEETFFAQRFAMFTDQFGVSWMLNLDKKG